MRLLISCSIVLFVVAQLKAEKPPLVEKYLHAGDFAEGAREMELALATNPNNDQLRFGLGVLQFVRGIERLGQSLHKYGVKSEHTNMPFLRLPVPKNPRPATIDYARFRGVLGDFIRDMSRAEITLAGIRDDTVILPLRLAEVRLDLDGDGLATDTLLAILKKLMRRDFGFLKTNPEFLVTFDRGDVAWLRAYCHLLSGMLEFYLTFDLEEQFDLASDELFERPENPFSGSKEEKRKKMQKSWLAVKVKDGRRLGRFRKHLIMVAVLNFETWKHIRAETDDDHEWLPNPQQKGLFGLPVRNGMIDGWLKIICELQALFEGQRAFFGVDLKVVCDNPPDEFENSFFNDHNPQYASDAKEVDASVFFSMFRIFQDSTAVAYAVWFN